MDMDRLCVPLGGVGNAGMFVDGTVTAAAIIGGTTGTD